MTNTQSNKQIQNVKVIVNNNTAPPKRKPRRNPAPPPPPPDVQLPTPKMETWRMQSPYPAQPIQYSLPVTQIFPEKSVTPSYFEGHLTNMQNTLKELREAHFQHVKEIRNELLSRASTQQHAANIEKLVRGIIQQHEDRLSGAEAVSGNDAQQAPQQTPPFAPPQPNAQQQQQQALHDINDFEMYSNPSFNKELSSPKTPQQAQHNSLFSNPLYDEDLWQQATMFSNSGESQPRPVDDVDNESQARTQKYIEFDKAAEKVYSLWQDYNNVNKKEKSKRLKEARAIASTWGIDNKGKMKTLVRRFAKVPF